MPSTQAQKREKVFKKKRKQVEISNYSLFLHLHDLSIEYATELEFKTDSLLQLKDAKTVSHNLFEFRSRSIQTLQHVLYKSDPIIAFFDGWAFCMQMEQFLETESAKEYLGNHLEVYQELFRRLAMEFPQIHTELTGNTPEKIVGDIQGFTQKYPIDDFHLNRTSVTDETAKWVGEAKIGFKSGVSTLTDALRSLSDRANYYTEFTPKLTQWYIEQTLQRYLGDDTLTNYLDRSVTVLESSANLIEMLPPYLLNTRDTILFDINRQRNETLDFIRAERSLVFGELKNEREIVLMAISKERESIEEMVSREREITLKQAEVIALNLTETSFQHIDQIIDKLFIRTLLLFTVMGILALIGVVLYKKL
jgi:hypothetical protein